jgi:hypothetical protein
MPTFFQVFKSAFINVLGPHATIRYIASTPSLTFAHHTPIYDPVRDVVFFASNGGSALSFLDIDHNNQVGMNNLTDLPANDDVNVTVTVVRTAARNLSSTAQLWLIILTSSVY